MTDRKIKLERREYKELYHLWRGYNLHLSALIKEAITDNIIEAQLQHSQEQVDREVEEIKREVAREIFDEIEKKHGDRIGRIVGISIDRWQSLKEKYE